MLWLALHLPWLPLEALAAVAAAGPGARCVIAQRLVCVADPAAAAAGVAPGMAAATAIALLPGLQPLVREPAREAACQHLLALALSGFTPHLVLRADGMLLEVAGTLRLFGGLAALLAQIRRTLARCGHRARIGLAPTAAAAWLFAQVPDARRRTGRALQPEAVRAMLDALPVAPVLAVLQVEPRLTGLLQGIGCRCLHEVRALPRAGLRRRGGGELLRRLDAAYGQVPDPQDWFEPPLRFDAALELAQRADDAAMLGFAAQRLVEALAGWLAGQWLAAAAFSLWLQHETTGRHALPPTRLRIELGQPSREAAQIGGLLRERLQRCELPAAVYGLKLELDEAVALAGHEARLPWGGESSDGGDGDGRDFRALLDRLSARLGPGCVLRLQLRADHRPERAAVALPAAHPRAAAGVMATGDPASAALPSAPAFPPAAAAPRPAWLLPEPLRLLEQAGRPVHGGLLRLRTKAERIEAGWFDGALACRDYHVAEGGDHRLRWVFSERRGGELRWYLHGLFG